MLGLVDKAELVAAELVTNAAAASAAAGTDVIVCLRAEQRRLVIEVGDQVEALPILRRPSLADPRGFGLFLVASMSTRWGTRQEGSGEVIWSEMVTA